MELIVILASRDLLGTEFCLAGILFLPGKYVQPMKKLSVVFLTNSRGPVGSSQTPCPVHPLAVAQTPARRRRSLGNDGAGGM